MGMEQYQQLASEWHPTLNGELTPQNVGVGSSRKVWWVKECLPGQPVHVWSETVASRVAGNGCAVCAARLNPVNIEDFVEDPRLSQVWDPANSW